MSHAVTVTATARAAREHVFDIIVPIDLSSVFHGFGPLPAVTGTSDETGPWDAVGRSRTVRLSDGGTSAEQITSYERPSSFGYRVGPFAGVFGHVVSHADGSWIFVELDGTTQIFWTYQFAPRAGMGLVVRAILPLWRRYADRVLAECVAAAEQPRENLDS